MKPSAAYYLHSVKVLLLVILFLAGGEKSSAAVNQNWETTFFSEATPEDADGEELVFYLQNFQVATQAFSPTVDNNSGFSHVTCCRVRLIPGTLTETSWNSYKFQQKPSYLNFIYPFEHFW